VTTVIAKHAMSWREVVALWRLVRALWSLIILTVAALLILFTPAAP